MSASRGMHARWRLNPATLFRDLGQLFIYPCSIQMRDDFAKKLLTCYYGGLLSSISTLAGWLFTNIGLYCRTGNGMKHSLSGQSNLYQRPGKCHAFTPLMVHFRWDQSPLPGECLLR